nr:MAG TPA: hypothetical protein [Caudoviricetes sp.]
MVLEHCKDAHSSRNSQILPPLYILRINAIWVFRIKMVRYISLQV